MERNERAIKGPNALVFFVSGDSKRVSLPVNHLESTLARRLRSVDSKRLDVRRLRLKTGKTLCLAATADSKGLRFIRYANRVPCPPSGCTSELRRGSVPPPPAFLSW